MLSKIMQIKCSRKVMNNMYSIKTKKLTKKFKDKVAVNEVDLLIKDKTTTAITPK